MPTQREARATPARPDQHRVAAEHPRTRGSPCPSPSLSETEIEPLESASVQILVCRSTRFWSAP
jgi:hypothetical protein